MAAATKWFTRAVRGLRSFAYPEIPARPKVGLALGGGFARGIAHLGVLRVFEENDIPIDFIAGTSVGALVAAAYASGTSLDFMEAQGVTTTFHDFGRWTLSRYGMASNSRLEAYLHRFTAAEFFHQLNIPLSIVATDLVTGKSVHFTDGEIGPALRASCAYPALFMPVEYRGHFLADGFLTEAAPAEAVRELGAELVISVYLDPGLMEERPRNTVEVISRSFSIIQTHLVQPWRAATDILIEPDVNNVVWHDFAKTPQLVASGRAATEALLPKIKAALRANQHERVRQSARVLIGK
ncbi:MAG TPA: patatin-like phospholipase family protein [Candidatus Dormibacteraeota bacterium]|nr:patatin-like phospholipase family protein [Candidatus Dormibacteraeota bacterium]